MQRYKEDNIASAIIRTATYSDIFDYPLTFREVLKFLISDTKVAVEVVRENLKILADSERIYTDGEFYCLGERKNLIEVRKKRRKWSREKLTIAKKVVDKLRLFPWIKMVGVTGALAMENCVEDDDIDLMIITATNRLWITRLLLYLLSPLLGVARRKPREKEVKDKICFNLFLEENHLQIQSENLFFAHEICQVKPILNKNKTYEKFLWENLWVRKFLPNGVKINSKFKVQSSKSQFKTQNFFSIIFCFLDKVAYRSQFWYMKPRMTIEKISLHQAFFHPINLQNKIQTFFEERLKTNTKS